uniref:Uncharacterized protein n=1 Tax=Kalanchoe fedtschenkoi TaxID=63787 RepID=A0A7N0U3W9_KALFE
MVVSGFGYIRSVLLFHRPFHLSILNTSWRYGIWMLMCGLICTRKCGLIKTVD